MRILTCDPDVEILGDVLQSLIHNMRFDDIARYIEKYGLSDVQSELWYPIQPFLELLNEMAADSNRMVNFVAIGMGVAETAYMPPELGQPSFEELVMHWNDHYQANHRNGDIGYKVSEEIGDKHYQITLHGGLYPDDFEYGVLYGFAKRFLPQEVDFSVWYDDNEQRLDQGGEKTTIHVQWE